MYESGVRLDCAEGRRCEVTELAILQRSDDRVRQLVGLYAAEKARADKLNKILLEIYKIIDNALIRGRSDGKSGNGEPEAVRNV